MSDQRVVFISGSSRGIGRGIAETRAQKGDIVYITGRDEATVNDVVEAIAKNGGEARSFVGDLCQENVMDAALEKAFSEQGRLDVVIANIGSGKSQPGWDVEESEYRRIFDINFFSAIGLLHKAAHYLLKKRTKDQQLIAISSICGCEDLGAPIPYNAAKTALTASMKALSNHLAKEKIRVNTVSPGNVYFPGGTWDEKLKADREGILKRIEDSVPMNAFASPEDIAQGVSYLIEAAFVTGHNLVIDGGQISKLI